MGVVVAGVRHLAMQRDLLGMATVAADTAAELCEGLRSRCYLFHEQDSLLWTEAGDEFPASSGLAGRAARTRQTQVAQRADLDPDYRREVDDPDGNGSERVLAQPIVTADGETHAVVVVVRRSSHSEFSSADIASIAFWAKQVAPLFHMLHLEGLVDEANAVEIAGRRGVYREEALEKLAAGEEDLAVLLGRPPWWLRHSHLLVLGTVVTMMLFLGLVHVRDYTAGPAFVSDTNQVIALLPSQYRTDIEVGQPFIFDLEGQRSATQHLTVTSVSATALGVDELRRVLGPDVADRVPMSAPMIVVEARSTTPMHRGIIGHARIAGKRKPLVYLIFPGLERLLSDV
jgi:hypothetical protein